MDYLNCIECLKSPQYGFWNEYGEYMISFIVWISKILTTILIAFIVYQMKDYFDNKKEVQKKLDKKIIDFKTLSYELANAWISVVLIKIRTKESLDLQSLRMIEKIRVTSDLNFDLTKIAFFLSNNTQLGFYQNVNDCIVAFNALSEDIHDWNLLKNNLPKSAEGWKSITSKDSHERKLLHKMKRLDLHCDKLIDCLCQAHNNSNNYLSNTLKSSPVHIMHYPEYDEFDKLKSVMNPDLN